MKSREHIVCNGKAAFYASIYDDLRKAAMDCGWALGLHGSLSNDTYAFIIFIIYS